MTVDELINLLRMCDKAAQVYSELRIDVSGKGYYRAYRIEEVQRQYSVVEAGKTFTSIVVLQSNDRGLP